jgi:hypothetical protein
MTPRPRAVLLPSSLLLLTLATAHCAGDDSSGPFGTGDAGSPTDAGVHDATQPNDAGVDTAVPDASSSDAPVDAPPEAAACAHNGDIDGGPATTIDGGAGGASDGGNAGGGSIVFFDIGGADRPIDLSADGRIALLQDGTSAAGDVYLYDTSASTLTRVAVTGNPSLTLSTGLSADGRSISAFHGTDAIVAGVWDGCNGWSDIPSAVDAGCANDPDAGNPSMLNGAMDLTADGAKAVGYVWNGCATIDARMWTRGATGWTALALEHLGMAGGNNRASYVSANGALIGGFAQFPNADRVPAIWHSDGTGIVLDPTGSVIGEVLAVSHDGTVVAGPWNGTANGSFYWTQSEGVVQIGTLPNPQPQDQVWLNAIAGEGALIFGGDGDPSWSSGGLGSEEVAVVWTKAKGMRKLQDVVTARSIALPAGWDLTDVLASSSDGSVLLGYATDTTSPTLAGHTFVLKMAPSAY